MKKYFVTDNSRLAMPGGLFIHAKESDEYLAIAREKFPDSEFIKVDELYKELGKTDGSGCQIVLCKFSKAWKSAFETKYPKAEISVYKPF
jgi:hypothetical protein